MTRKTNYEDDIFTLGVIVRSLTDILRLEIDPEYFRERVAADIAFVDSAVNRIQDSLGGGSFLLKRNEYLRAIQKVKRSFVDLLDSILDKRVAFAEHLEGLRERYVEMRQAHEMDIAQIRSTLSQSKSTDEEHIVSADEYKFLLTPTEEGN